MPSLQVKVLSIYRLIGNATHAIKAEGNTHSPFVLMNSNIHLVKSSSLQNVGPLPISQPRIPGDDNSLQGLNLSFVKVTAPTKSQRHVFDKLKHERAAPELKTGTFHHLRQNYPTRLTGREKKFEDHTPWEQKMKEALVHVRFELTTWRYQHHALSTDLTGQVT